MSKIILQSYKHRSSVLYIPSVATALMIMAYNWQTNRYLRQQQQWFYRSSSSSLSSDRWPLRSAKLLSPDIDIDYISKRCLDSVCLCVPETYYRHPRDKSVRFGSGFRVRDVSEVLVVTNCHVVSGCNTILVHMCYNGRQCGMYGRAAYVEPHIDMALIRFAWPPVDNNWQPIPLATTHGRPPIGEPIVALGAFSTFITCSHNGIITADQITLDMADFQRVINPITTDSEYRPMVMHSSSVISGFSGGPLVNADGNVVALNAMRSGYGRNYGQSVDEVIEFIERAKLYDNRVFPWQQTYREIKYSLAPAVKLGVVLSKEDDIFTVEDILNDSRCRELQNKYILGINEQPLITIRQLTDALNQLTGADGDDVDDNHRQKLTLYTMDGISADDMDSYEASARLYTELPLVF
ncbi:serine protease HTRA3-like [Oppia nitens]|uniref:serine protease HTRA3-like n=1 Tax=Oppia nitens TaxID=1686743 RepID=UPI0023DC218C|nr:serine protease HTRA3-like [Oppia nitens]